MLLPHYRYNMNQRTQHNQAAIYAEIEPEMLSGTDVGYPVYQAQT